MKRKSFQSIIRKIKEVLESESDLSVRQISKKIKCNWDTTNIALTLLKDLEVVKEREDINTKRKTRLFSLNKKL